MKKCPYCGGEFSDALVVCPFDQTPFDKNYQPPIEVAAQASATPKRDIPTALSVVSYLFFAIGIFNLAVGGFLIYIGGPLSPFIIVGILWVLISRGLRRGSRVARFCALLITWLGFGAILWEAYTAVSPFLRALYHKPVSALPVGFLCLLAVGLVIQIWQYNVLTRSDVRESFYES